MLRASRRASPVIVGAEWFPDTPSGLNRYVRDLFVGLGQAGVEPAAIVVGPAREAPANLTAVPPGPTALRAWRMARAIAAARSRGDVIDTHFALYGFSAALVARLTGRPLVVHFHGPWSGESAVAGHRSRLAISLQHSIERLVYRRAARLVVLSSAFKELVVERYGVAPERVEVVAPGVDLEQFSPGSREDARRRLNVPVDAVVGLTVRRLVRRLGVDDLIRAWSRVQGEDRLLLVAGTGPEEQALRALAAHLGLEESVRFLGFVPDAALPDLYRAADVCVIPTRDLEGFGLVTLEALACGTPVLASDTGGLSEALAGLGEDLIVPAGDHVALADRLADSFDGSRPLPDAAACRRHAERFSIGRFIGRHVELYDALARAPKSRAQA